MERVPPLDAEYLLLYKNTARVKLIEVEKSCHLRNKTLPELEEMLQKKDQHSKEEVRVIKIWICQKKESPKPIPVSYEKLSAYITRRTYDYHFAFGQFVSSQAGTPQYQIALDALMELFSKQLNYFVVAANNQPSRMHDSTK